MRCASLCIGIKNYREPKFRSAETFLHFAVTDAEAFYGYTTLAYPDATTQSFHLLYVDEAATLRGVEQAFELIAQAGQFDLVMIYLSGHGQHNSDGTGWFCLWDALPNIPSLDGKQLNTMLSKLNCAQTLLIIDCCHAESVISGLPYFSDLQGSDTRIFCASSRTNEYAWEDAVLQRSVLSHVLFSALSKISPLADSSGYVNVDGSLLPYLRDHVPLLAAKTKRGAIQQPIIGGQAAVSIKLPTVQIGNIGRSLTLRELLHYQLRRLITWLIATIVIILALIETLFSHLVLLSDQTVVVRPGLASTFNFLPVHLSKAVDTGFNGSQLNLTQIDAMQSLSNGGLRTITTLRTPDGLREWIEQLTPLLKDRNVLDFIYPNAPGKSYTFSAINFSARIKLMGPENYSKQQQLLLHAPLTNISCIFFGNEQRINFDTDDNDSLEEFIKAFVRYIAVQSKDPSDEIWKLSRLIAFRALERSYDTVSQREINVLIEEISRAKNLTLSSGTLSSLRSLLPPSPPSNCSILAISILISKANIHDQQEAEMIFRAIEPSAQKSLSEILTAFRRNGIKNYLISQPRDMLTIIGKYRLLQKETISALSNINPDDFDAKQEQLLENMALTSSTYEMLFKNLHDNNGPELQGVALRSLARAYTWLSPSQREDLQSWVQKNSLERLTETNITLGVGLLGRHCKISKAIIDVWVKKLSAGVIDPEYEADSNHTIVVDARDAVAALAMVSATTSIPTDAKGIVELLLANRASIPLRQEAIEGLGMQLRLQEKSLAEAIRRQLLTQRDSVKQRQLTISIAVAAINGLQEDLRATVLNDIAEFWSEESEPELRKAFGLILAGVN